ncbi:MAG: SurA N-terminal domain-containing protein [Deltaproteobacteria bacterium]|nr:SurA N-terminal domain-containing protein [Deltaproteobacteria bacterium]
MRKRAAIVCLFTFATLLFSACGSKNNGEQEVVGTVNNAPISEAELQKEVVRYSRQNPQVVVDRRIVEERLNTLIEKKLMIQEAVKKGLTKDERFVETIKTFWEQTLIRELLDAKNKEWADRLYVTEDEIRKEYERMQYQPRLLLVKAETKPAADEIAKAMQSGKHPAGAENVGPLFYGDVRTSPLANAFDMKEGEVKAFPSGDQYVVIRVTAKEAMPLPPLKEVHNRIQDSILAAKKQEAIAEWMAGVRKSAKIKINYKELHEAAHE